MVENQKALYWNKMVPELIVSNLQESLAFWVNLIGFEVMYQSEEERFVYLDLLGAQVMLEEMQPEQWVTGELEKPLGRGINFQIEVPAVKPILERLERENYPLFDALEERWYQANDLQHGQRQFLVQDPDGYLLRLVEVLGEVSV
ncbi:VOC family protein [Ignatzschineria rhizosphaerae]|uniref:Bleomycin resistance protein n=1 Tax=Ignatzschineria rhizosphaerae TaxID=2923279 RepID=A0ABY3X010_9GAMM|nr:VOC family protein [Ignatzschineria rhizosphaerae]UNM96234.1 VOC family protein [Ignatzschineria rhizosphaerae]